MIRWQGSTIGIGLRFITVPTARAALGRPTSAARCAVGVDATVGDAGELVQHCLVERRDAQVERQVERAPAAVEVLVELATHLVERRAEHAGAEGAGDHFVLAFDGERDAAEAARGRGEEELADRGGDDVVADVDEPFAEGGGAEALRRAQV